MTGIKRRLREAVIVPFVDPQFARYDVGLANGLLLFGPPRTGMTSLATVLVGEPGFAFADVTPADVVSKTVGAGVENVSDVFEAAAERTTRPPPAGFYRRRRYAGV